VRLSTATRERLAFALAGAAALFYVERALAEFQDLGIGRQLEYDYLQFWRAASDLAHGRDLYVAFLTNCPLNEWCRGGYIYPPLFAELFRPLLAFDPYAGAAIWLWVNHLMVVACMVVVYYGLRRWLTPTLAALLAAGWLAFLPLQASLYFMQVNVLLLLLLSLAAVAFVADDRRPAAGAWLATAAMLRVTPILMVPTLLQKGFRRRPLPVIALVITGGLLAIVSWLANPGTPRYFSVVLPRLGNGTAFYENQSVPGLFLRIQDLVMHQRPQPFGLFPIALMALVLGVTWRMSWAVTGPKGRAAVFAAFLAATPVVSSITWQHHLVSEMLAIALLAPSMGVSRAGRGLIIASYPFLWIDIHSTIGIAGSLGLNSGILVGSQVPLFLLFYGWNTVGMTLLWLGALAVLRTLRRELSAVNTEGSGQLRAGHRGRTRSAILDGAAPPLSFGPGSHEGERMTL
jgi:hypothetical protein